MIRECVPSDFDEMFSVINAAAEAYKGVIPDDRWHDPYMPTEDLKTEIRNGVEFWCFAMGTRLLGGMGKQKMGHVTLIRHAYVHPLHQHSGIGTRLLQHLEGLASGPILIGTWQAARWAIAFYERNGYRRTSPQETAKLLKLYWNIPARQAETSVVLARGERNSQPSV
jgi:GNAT superfamily N-acetyltransferase